jgi:hypothetical protein
MKKMLHTTLVLAFLAFTSLLLIAPARAQSIYGSIFGTVTDSTGAAVPNATITVKDEAKGTVVTTTTNASGDYNVPHLIPDLYDLRVSAKGFKVFEAKGIQIETDTAPRIDPILQVGGGAETITVNADQEPELKTDRADVGTVFDQQQVSSLPVGDQNFTNLQLLLPGAQLLGWSHTADENPQGSKQIQVDGQAFGGIAYELDGADNQDPILGIIVINPTMDAVTETKITTQNFDAEQGKAVSAVMTAQTKSGTNEFHGGAYDFRTGNANVARDPYTQAPGSVPAGLKNRMGVSIGGPVLKNRAFFFFNYEGVRQKVGTSGTDTLPTSLLTETALGKEVGPSGISGADFSEYLTQFGAAGTIYDQTKLDASGHPTPFPNNVIPASYLSQPALNMLTYLESYTKNIGLNPAISEGGLDQNYHAGGTGVFNTNQWTVRGDYTVNDKAHAFARFSRFWDTLSGKEMFGDAGGPGFGPFGYGGTSQGANDSDAVGMDIAVNPKLLTDFRLGYLRYNIASMKYDQTVDFANTLGMPGLNLGTLWTSGAPGFFIQAVPGGGGQFLYGAALDINRCNCPFSEREDQFQIVNNWTKILGNHSFKAGVDLRYGRNLRVPSDTDRAGDLSFGSGPTSDLAASTQGGLGIATFLLGQVSGIIAGGNSQAESQAFGRYVESETNAKEFQKRTFFYGQDTWRITHKLSVNLGLRWELYFPETVNGVALGGLMDLSDGYIHVAEVGGIPSDMGWKIDKKKMFAPRLGATYQLDPKTVIRAGYGRSFDTGVFGSIFGHTVTQNLPVLANQEMSSTGTGYVFGLAAGPPAPVSVTVPSNGLLPNPGAYVTTKVRPNPLRFPTIDAWNLAVQRVLTPTINLTVAYVGNKGTHTLGDGDNRFTNPNEAAINLPGSYSFNGQALHYDPAGTTATQTLNTSTWGTASNFLLSRYYGGSLPACRDSNYTSPGSGYSDIVLKAGACGWTQAIFNQGDDQNTEFDALQITLEKQLSKGLTITANYQWASAFDEAAGYFTWDHKVTHGRDSNVRDQQLVTYGSYDLPFGKGKQYASSVNRATDLLIGGYQLSGTMNWAGGLPFTLNYNEASSNVPSSAPSYPSAAGGRQMKTHLTSFTPTSSGTGTRSFYEKQTTDVITDPGTGVFVNPGLDNIGNVGFNTYRGPSFFTSDWAITKAFTIRENIVTKFRMDAFNAFNHITAGNPGGNVESVGTISSEGQGCGPGDDCGPRQLEFSLRVQF